MTDKTMTEVRDWHLDAYKVTGQPKHKDMADAITRHLSQTAERGEAVACDLYVECRQCEDCTHIGINDASETASACGDCEWQGSMPAGDKCPGCAHENCMAVACPICGGRYQFLVDRKFVAHPPAAGVPDTASLKNLIRGFGYTTQSQSWDLAEAVIGALSAAPSPAIGDAK